MGRGNDEIESSPDDVVHSSGLREKLTGKRGTILGSLAGTTFTVLALIQKGAVLGSGPLLDLIHLLLLALAIGWLGRSVIHGFVGYFRRTKKEGIGRWTLPAVSTVNACFCVVWLVLAIFLLLTRGGTAPTGAVVILSCGLCFVLSLCTHWAAEQAGRPRASDWVADRYREPLEPGKSTPVGWILIKLIDWRSAPHHLSTFVAGTLAALLVALLLTASATLSEASHERASLGQNTAAGKPSARPPKHPLPSTLPTGSVKPSKIVSAGTSTERRGISLLCFPLTSNRPLPSSDPKPSGHSLFCIVVAGDRLTARALILTPEESR